MDAAQFPSLAFDGECRGDTMAGRLTLHGQTHPFTLELERSATTLIETGRLQRAEWGMTARRFTAGSTIRIRVAMPNPFNAAHT